MKYALMSLMTWGILITLPSLVIAEQNAPQGRIIKKGDDPNLVFIEYFEIQNKDEKQRLKIISQYRLKEKQELEKKGPKLNPAEKKTLKVIKMDLALYKAGYNPYKMTAREKRKAFGILNSKIKK